MYDWAEFRHFRYLLAILERQSFRLASEQLNTVQSNLSSHARNFQDHSGLRLYRKSRSGRISPTKTGHAFRHFSRFLLETKDEVIEALIAIERGEADLIRLGCAALANQALFKELCGLHKAILPESALRITRGDTRQLVKEVADGILDAAVVTLPVQHPDLRVEELRRDPLVVCLRKDDPLASKAVLFPADLNQRLCIFYEPDRHPDAHARLMELLTESGINVEECSRSSHPSETQSLVAESHAFAFLPEGIPLEPDLTTRRLSGVDWTVDTAIVVHKTRYPKTLPVLIKQLRNSGVFSGATAVKNAHKTPAHAAVLKRSITTPTASEQLNLLS